MLDVTFVLLIAFMMVAPSLNYGEEIALPQVAEGAPQLSSDQQKTAVIGISKAHVTGNGVRQYQLDGVLMELDAMEGELRRRNQEAEGKLAVEVQADRDVPYEAFVHAVGALRRAGIEGVGLPVDTVP